MSFLRRISNAAQTFLPNLPNSQGIPAPHVPRRATETYTKPIHGGKLNEVGEEESEDSDEPEQTARKPSWELSDSESNGESSSSRSERSSRESVSDDDDWSSEASSDSEMDAKGRPKDKFDMMARHLWNVGDRQGWFRDADFDGLVSLRYVISLLSTEVQ